MKVGFSCRRESTHFSRVEEEKKLNDWQTTGNIHVKEAYKKGILSVS